MAKPLLKVVCRGKRRESILVGLARALESAGREGDAAAARVLRGEGTLADLAKVERAEKVAAFVTG